jgi:hypothetical protein
MATRTHAKPIPLQSPPRTARHLLCAGCVRLPFWIPLAWIALIFVALVLACLFTPKPRLLRALPLLPRTQICRSYGTKIQINRSVGIAVAEIIPFVAVVLLPLLPLPPLLTLLPLLPLPPLPPLLPLLPLHLC